MERFVKEYASYIIKNAKAYKDTEKIAKVEKICKMRMRGLISPTEECTPLRMLMSLILIPTDTRLNLYRLYGKSCTALFLYDDFNYFNS